MGNMDKIFTVRNFFITIYAIVSLFILIYLLTDKDFIESNKKRAAVLASKHVSGKPTWVKLT